jgi:hypothetical protein
MKKTVTLTRMVLCALLPLATLACSSGGEATQQQETAGIGGGVAITTPGTGAAAAVDPSATEAAAPWAGVYTLEAPAPYWSEPENIGSEIGLFVPIFLLNVSGETVTLGTATADETTEVITQDPCTSTQVVTAQVAQPSFQLGPIDYQMHLVNDPVRVNATIYQLTMTNVLPPTEGGELSAILDAREVYPLFTALGKPTAETVCAALESFGAPPCAPCPQDGALYCLAIRAIALEAKARPDLVVATVDSATGGEQCADSNPNAAENTNSGVTTPADSVTTPDDSME